MSTGFIKRYFTFEKSKELKGQSEKNVKTSTGSDSFYGLG
jgi:hypothetical protein